MTKRPATEAGQRIYAVGDIHGRADLLARLLAMIETDALGAPEKKKKLVFLGDYVDRGLDSKKVLERLQQPFAAGLEPVFLRGNHDDFFLSFLKGDLSVTQPWFQLGGTATVASYGVNVFGAGAGKTEKIRQELAEKVPPEHLAFLERTIFSAAWGDYVFVHAGLRPGVPLVEQKDEDKMWIRGDFLFSDFDFKAVIVHGHTIRPEPEIRKNRIGLDTGAFATGRLTCLVLDGEDRRFLAT